MSTFENSLSELAAQCALQSAASDELTPQDAALTDELSLDDSSNEAIPACEVLPEEATVGPGGPKFVDFQLLDPIQRALEDEKYVSPTPIQAATIPHLMEGKDLLGIAQTGTGKTAAFALPILHRIGSRPGRTIPLAPRALVLSPTRELALQIADKFRCYSRHMRIWTSTAFGGVSQFNQVRELRRGVHILVATPGRLLDLIDQGYILLDRLEVFVLDEADRMLDMGFMPDINRVVEMLPAERQSLFFSATMPPKIEELARTLLQDPVRVDLTPSTRTVELIEQRVMHVAQSDKQSLLCHVLDSQVVGQALVFSRTKHGAERLAEQLTKAGFAADAIHGDKTQSARQRALFDFKSGRTRVLVATDVAARGIDIQGLSHVINYELPIDPESYVHRVGRTGRAGASGIAISMCDPRERGALRAIEREIGIKIRVETDHPHAINLQAPRGGSRDGQGRGYQAQGQRRFQRGGGGGYGNQGGGYRDRGGYRDQDYQNEGGPAPRGGAGYDRSVGAPPVGPAAALPPIQLSQGVPPRAVIAAKQPSAYPPPAQQSYPQQTYGDESRGRQDRAPRPPYQEQLADRSRQQYGHDQAPPQPTEAYGTPEGGRRPFNLRRPQGRKQSGGGYGAGGGGGGNYGHEGGNRARGGRRNYRDEGPGSEPIISVR